MGLLQEFKEFAMRGNVVDLAVGIIIGSAFGKIVDALVKNVIMPPIGFLAGGDEFSKLAITLGKNAAGDPVVLGYGAFVQAVVDFLIVAFAIFMMIKVMNSAQKFARMQEKKDDTPAPPAEDIVLLREIRDALQKS